MDKGMKGKHTQATSTISIIQDRSIGESNSETRMKQTFTNEAFIEDCISEVPDISIEIEDSVENPNSFGRNNQGQEPEVCKTEEPTYKHKLANTTLALWNMVTSGMLMGQIGPALPDLQRITESSLQEASWLFTGYGIGFMVGCLLSGYALDRFNSRLIQFALTLCTTVTLAVLPWVPIVFVSVLVRVLQGITISGQETVNLAIVFQVWAAAGGPYIQMLYIALGLGGILSPLYTKPFLSDEESEGDIDTPSENLTTVSFATSNTTNMEHLTTDILVHYAFFITAMACLSSALSFIIAYTCKLKHISYSVQTGKEESNSKTMLPLKMKYLILALMCCVSFNTRGCLFNFANFLPTFVIRQLQWTQQSAATLVSIRYMSFSVGNVLGFIFLKLTSTNKVILAAYVMSIVTLACCIVGSIFGQTVVIWVTIVVCNITKAVYLPTQYTWIEENVTHISGRIASTMIFTGASGFVLFPILAGYLMDSYSPLWFLYLNFGGFILCFILFISALALFKYFKQPFQDED